jgi:hypothetical protein
VDAKFWSDAWQWWLNTGLEGIGGAILGGIAAGLVLRATIRHERKLRQDEAEAAKWADLKREVVGLHAELSRLLFSQPRETPEWNKFTSDMYRAVIRVTVVGSDTDAVLVRDLEEFLDLLAVRAYTPADGWKGAGVLLITRAACKRCAAWLAKDPVAGVAAMQDLRDRLQIVVAASQ